LAQAVTFLTTGFDLTADRDDGRAGRRDVGAARRGTAGDA
jgi:hypothetical protein